MITARMNERWRSIMKWLIWGIRFLLNCFVALINPFGHLGQDLPSFNPLQWKIGTGPLYCDRLVRLNDALVMKYLFCRAWITLRVGLSGCQLIVVINELQLDLEIVPSVTSTLATATGASHGQHSAASIWIERIRKLLPGISIELYNPAISLDDALTLRLKKCRASISRIQWPRMQGEVDMEQLLLDVHNEEYPLLSPETNMLVDSTNTMISLNSFRCSCCCSPDPTNTSAVSVQVKIDMNEIVFKLSRAVECSLYDFIVSTAMKSSRSAKDLRDNANDRYAALLGIISMSEEQEIQNTQQASAESSLHRIRPLPNWISSLDLVIVADKIGVILYDACSIDQNVGQEVVTATSYHSISFNEQLLWLRNLNVSFSIESHGECCQWEISIEDLQQAQITSSQMIHDVTNIKSCLLSEGDTHISLPSTSPGLMQYFVTSRGRFTISSSLEPLQDSILSISLQAAIAPFCIPLHVGSLVSLLSATNEIGIVLKSLTRSRNESGSRAVERHTIAPMRSMIWSNIEIECHKAAILIIIPVRCNNDEHIKDSILVQLEDMQLSSREDEGGDSQRNNDISLRIDKCSIATASFNPSYEHGTQCYLNLLPSYLNCSAINVQFTQRYFLEQPLPQLLPQNFNGAETCNAVILDKWACSIIGNRNQWNSSTRISFGNVSLQPTSSDLECIGIIVGAFTNSLRRYQALGHFHSYPIEIITYHSSFIMSRLEFLVHSFSAKLIVNENLTSESDGPEIRRVYTFLDKNAVRCVEEGIANIFSSQKLYISGEIGLSSQVMNVDDILKSGNNKHASVQQIIKLVTTDTAADEKPSNNEWQLLLKSKRLVDGVHLLSNGLLGIGRKAKFTDIHLHGLQCELDVLHLEKLMLAINLYSKALNIGLQLASQMRWNRNNLLHGVDLPQDTAFATYTTPLVDSPTSLVSVQLDMLHLHATHNFEPVLAFYSTVMDFHSIRFGPTLTQTTSVLHSIRLFELTADYASHTCLITDIDKDSLPNRCEFHMSRIYGEKPIIEVSMENMQLMYLQRAMLTMISYIRDYLLDGIFSSLRQDLDLSLNITVAYFYRSLAALLQQNELTWMPDLAPSRGFVRFGVLLSRCELHIPLNSCATDALVAIIPLTYIFRTCPVIVRSRSSTRMANAVSTSSIGRNVSNDGSEHNYILADTAGDDDIDCLYSNNTDDSSDSDSECSSDRSESNYGEYYGNTDPSTVFASNEALAYCAGPHQAKKLWIGEVKNARRVIHHLFRDNATGGPNSCLSIHRAGHTNTPYATATLDLLLQWALPLQAKQLLVPPTCVQHTSASKIAVDFKIFSATICSWCNQNAVGENINLTGSFDMVPVQPPPEDGIVRNTMTIDIKVDDIDWHLAQGQYMCIVNMIQHNFGELQIRVPDVFILPTPQIVHLTEQIYGRYALDRSLAVVTFLSLHFRSGKIMAVHNSKDYYKNFLTPPPGPHHPFNLYGHSTGNSCKSLIDQGFQDTVPKYSNHVQHRNRLFDRLIVGQKPFQLPNLKGLSLLARTVTDDESDLTQSIIGVLFKRLVIDFQRRHYGGGNGIDVSADTLIILGSGLADDDDVQSENSVDLDDVNIASVIFAPRSCAIFNDEPHNRSKSKKKRKGIDTNTGDAAMGTRLPHIRYNQQGTGNLRRCVITIEDSVAVANIASILEAVQYFIKPIHFNTQRNLNCIQAAGNRPYDFKAALDVELRVKNTVACMSNIDKIDGANGLCFQINLEYLQAWRGFVFAGPGLISLGIDVDFESVYIAPLHEINSPRIQSLVDACFLQFAMELRILPLELDCDCNTKLLSPWIEFSPREKTFTRKSTPGGIRIVKFVIVPEKYSSSSKSNKRKTIAEERDEHVGELSDVADQSENQYEDSAVGDEFGVETSFGFLQSEHQLPDFTIGVHLSMKDIFFIIGAVQQLRGNMNKRVVNAIVRDPFVSLASFLEDVRHLPPLTYYVVHCNLSAPWQEADSNDLDANICDFQVLLRNNTYNLNILRANVFENRLMFNRSPVQLHMAAGSNVAVWSYNESNDIWEPLIEPLHLQSIGATDESRSGTELNSKIRIEVVTGALEVNAAASTLGALISKLSLADVVTTSSIHLPPYKIINDIGVNLQFTIGMSGGIIRKDEIPANNFLPIEVQQLSEALNVYKMRRQYNVQEDGEWSHGKSKQYLMGITFSNFRDVYSSKIALPIDKVGVHPFEMIHSGANLDPEVIEESAEVRETSCRPLSVDRSRISAISYQDFVQEDDDQSVNSERISVDLNESSNSIMGVSEPLQNSAGNAAMTADTTSSRERVEPIKFFKELPLAVLDMKIKDDGVRELLIRSILSFKNQTSRVFQISVRLYGSSTEKSLGPGQNWNVPVRFANPRAAVFFRLDERHEWFEGLPHMQSLISHGQWGDPSRLRAQMCACPVEDEGTNTEHEKDARGKDWIILIKPESRDPRVESSSSKSYTPVRFPGKESHNALKKASQHASNVPYRSRLNESRSTIDEKRSSSGMHGSSSVSSGLNFLKSRMVRSRPMCVHLLAPLQLCNVLSQPLLYRIADSDGLIVSEGLLLPGELVDIHNLHKLFTAKYLVSIRMINYSWSKWFILFTRTTPYSHVERSQEITLPSLDLNYEGKDLMLPSLNVTVISKEHLVRFTCPILISNRSGLALDFCEASSTENYMPQSSRMAVECLLPAYSRKFSHVANDQEDTVTKKGRRSRQTSRKQDINGKESSVIHSSQAKQGSLPPALNSPSKSFHLAEGTGEIDTRVKDDEQLLDDSRPALTDSYEPHPAFGNSEWSTSLRYLEQKRRAVLRSNSSGLDGKYKSTGRDSKVDLDDGEYLSESDSDDSGMGDEVVKLTPSDRDGPERSFETAISRNHTPITKIEAISSPFTLPLQTSSGKSMGLERTVSSMKSTNPIITLIVHMPFDHLRKIELVASSEWHLYDVFAQIKKKLCTASIYRKQNHYVFFHWKQGKTSRRKFDSIQQTMVEDGSSKTEQDLELSSHNESVKPGSANSTPPRLLDVVSKAMNASTESQQVTPAPATMSSAVSSLMRRRSSGGGISASSISSGGRGSNMDPELPSSMQFDMLADCDFAPIPMESKVGSLTSFRLRLCHVSEWNIYKQVKSIKTIISEREGLFSSMFSKPKCVFKSAFMKIEGDIPFRPSRMLGFNPCLSLRVSNYTDWSDAFDIIKADFAAEEMTINLNPTEITNTVMDAKHSSFSLDNDTTYELGIYLERGSGFLSNVTAVTVVPKHILISKLSMPIQLKVIFADRWVEPMTLLPGMVQSYHFPVCCRSKILHVRRGNYSATKRSHDDNDSDGYENSYPNDADSNCWQGEIDICKLGIVYTKLVNPLVILKVHVEIVGASLVATFSEQNALWPPYRLDNLTEIEMRFRQVVDDNVTEQFTSSASEWAVTDRLQRTFTIDSIDERSEPRLVVDSAAAENDAIDAVKASAPAKPITFRDWTALEKKTSASYAWDLPLSGKKILCLEIKEIDQKWLQYEVNLDDDAKEDEIKIKKKMPSVGNPLAEGELLWFDPVGDQWKTVYCILRPDVMYMYHQNRSHLVGIINMSMWKSSPPAPGKVQVQSTASTEVDYACVVKHSEKSWDILQSSLDLLSSAIGASKTKLAFDSNKIRMIILQVADGLGLYCASDDVSSGRGSGSSSPNNPELQGNENNDDEFSEAGAINKVGDERDESAPEKEVEIRSDEIQNERTSLIDLLKAGTSTDQLLDNVKNIPVRASEVIKAFIDTNIVDRTDKAAELFEWMVLNDILHPRFDRRQAIDSSCFSGHENESFLKTSPLKKKIESSHQLKSIPEDDPSSYDSQRMMDDLTHKLVESSNSRRDDHAQNTENILENDLAEDVQTSHPSSTNAFSFSFGNISVDVGSDGHVRMNSQSKCSADPAVMNPSSKSSSRLSKKMTVQSLEGVDLFFNPPSLNSEMEAMLAEMEEKDQLDSPHGTGERDEAIFNPKPGAAREALDNDGYYGFSIVLGGPNSQKNRFKCKTEMEFIGWVQSCRQSIERSWMEHELGHKKDKSPVCLDDFQANLILKLRADGSTKVLEILEDEDADNLQLRRSRHKRRHQSGLQAFLPSKGKKGSVDAFSKLQNVIRRMNAEDDDALARNAAGQQFSDEQDEKELISVTFAVNSVALSIIDNGPMELLYLSMHNLEMDVERSIDLVKFSVTVQEIQWSNQLLNPHFPVALFPRRTKAMLQGGQLMLPGLNQNRQTIPSMHLHIQQRYHQSADDVAGSVGDVELSSETHLHYFEFFTLWIAPVQLDIDEEIVVRLFRFAHGLKEILQSPGLGSNIGMLGRRNILESLRGQSLQGEIERRALFQFFSHFADSGMRPYLEHDLVKKSSHGVYFSVLQLHPLDIVMSYRPSPGLSLSLTNAELALISVVSQLDSARLCLNALIVEHAFGTPSFVVEVIQKHYKNAFWRQFHRLIGSSDLVEGSVGLVANLGSGVYDLFYEPIDGLLDENNTFLKGLSKGGMSLASRTIGGTSAFTSKITGGLGKGMSMLTLDADYQRNRSSRRFVKTTTMTEGLYVGTQELGKNIMEGVTGIVVSPYRGWESGGSVGFGLGVAKGLLGVALKPAVGVFDFASRATEGIRNSAFNVSMEIIGERYGIHRKRIPRAFGRNGIIALYDPRAAAAQYTADTLTNFKYDPRLKVVHFTHIIRQISHSTLYNSFFLQSKTLATAGSIVDQSILTEELEYPATEAWGIHVGESYLVLVGPDRVALTQILSDNSEEPPNARSISNNGSKSTGYDGVNSEHCGSRRGIVVNAKKLKKTAERKFIWSCPAASIDQLFSDTRGDLILSLNNPVNISGQWNNPSPVILEPAAQNYLIFQSLLEQTIGFHLARLQPIQPASGLMQHGILKRYATGLRSYLLSPSKHTYRIFGHVLYEYTPLRKHQQSNQGIATNPTVSESQVVESGDTDEPDIAKDVKPPLHSMLTKENEPSAQKPGEEVEIPDPGQSDAFFDQVISTMFPTAQQHEIQKKEQERLERELRNSDSLAEGIIAAELEAIREEEHENEIIEQDGDSTSGHEERYASMEHTVTNITAAIATDDYFGTSTGATGDEPESGFSQQLLEEKLSSSRTQPLPDDTFLSFVYPLVDMYVVGPVEEENGKFYSITLTRDDGQKMRTLRREEDQDYMAEYMKNNLSLIFDTYEEAQYWCDQLEMHVVKSPSGIIPQSALTTEEQRRKNRTVIMSIGGSKGGNGDVTPSDDSILGMLVIPTSGCDPRDTEMLKIEIAKTLSVVRRM